MKILFLSAEAAPFVAVGGLSQVMYFLPRALKRKGHDARVFTAFYGSTDREALEKRWRPQGKPVDVRVSAASAGTPRPEPKEGEPSLQDVECAVTTYRPAEDDDVWATLLENREYFELRANVFGYADDHVRFAILSKGCLEWLRVLDEARKKGARDAWWPDVIHCHDWHTGYFVDLARRDPRYRQMLKDVSVVYTVHNFRYQGNGDLRYLPPEEMDDGEAPLAALDDPRLRKQNALKRGLLYADAVTTVSPTHALEVLTPEYAEGLLETVMKVRGKLSGILNGIDPEEFDPSGDPNIKRRYGRRWFAAAREANKKDLQRQFSLPIDPAKPLMGYIGRLDQQKGLDLLAESVGRLMEERGDAQLVVVGAGEDRFRTALEELRSRFPDRIGLYLLADFRLPRKVFAGADLVLVPSFFEPGGIVALEAMRYGAVPLVRRTGGLNDSVQDFDPGTREGTGFSFRSKSAWSMFAALVEALTVYRQRSLWQKVVENCLEQDFSWDHAAEEYEEWYGRALRERRRPSKRDDLLSLIRSKL
jgi:starch synthase